MEHEAGATAAAAVEAPGKATRRTRRTQAVEAPLEEEEAAAATVDEEEAPAEKQAAAKASRRTRKTQEAAEVKDVEQGDAATSLTFLGARAGKPLHLHKCRGYPARLHGKEDAVLAVWMESCSLRPRCWDASSRGREVRL